MFYVNDELEGTFLYRETIKLYCNIYAAGSWQFLTIFQVEGLTLSSLTRTGAPQESGLSVFGPRDVSQRVQGLPGSFSFFLSFFFSFLLSFFFHSFVLRFVFRFFFGLNLQTVYLFS